MADGDINRLEVKLDKILTLLNGNGTPGVFGRLDRLEQWQLAFSRWATPVLIMVLGQFVLFIIGLLVNRIEIKLP